MMNPIDIRPSPCPAQSDRDPHAKFRRHTSRRFGVSGYLNSTVLLLNIDIVQVYQSMMTFDLMQTTRGVSLDLYNSNF